jgi:hypothetical protein
VRRVRKTRTEQCAFLTMRLRERPPPSVVRRVGYRHDLGDSSGQADI